MYFVSAFVFKTPVGRESSVGIATRYGMDGPGMEFPQPFRPALRST
jgi:hypothetical protein